MPFRVEQNNAGTIRPDKICGKYCWVKSVLHAVPLFHSCVVIKAGLKILSFITFNNIIQSTSKLVPPLLFAHEKSVNRNSLPHRILINFQLRYIATKCVKIQWCYIRIWLYIYSPEQLHDNNLNIRQFLGSKENARFAVCEYTSCFHMNWPNYHAICKLYIFLNVCHDFWSWLQSAGELICFNTIEILILKATAYLLMWKGPSGDLHHSQRQRMFHSRPILRLVITSVKFTLLQN